MGRANNSFTAWTGQANIPENRALIPEERLFIAVLSQAAHDAFSTHVGRLEREAARAFFTNKSGRFKYICELAGRESEYVYKKIQKRILAGDGWSLEESLRKTNQPKKRQRRRRKKHLTGNAYYAKKAQKNFYYEGIRAKGGRPRIYNEIKR